MTLKEKFEQNPQSREKFEEELRIELIKRRYPITPRPFEKMIREEFSAVCVSEYPLRYTFIVNVKDDKGRYELIVGIEYLDEKQARIFYCPKEHFIDSRSLFNGISEGWIQDQYALSDIRVKVREE